MTYDETYRRITEMVTIHKLQPHDKDLAYIEAINEASFPPRERMSLAELVDFAAKTDTDILGIYADDRPIGFTVVLKNDVYAYLYFLAIAEADQSMGYGGKTLQQLAAAYPTRQLALDLEVIDERAADNDQRIRRKAFYLRHGFHETGHYVMLRDEPFEVLCTGGDLDKASLRELIHVIHVHRPELVDRLL